MDAVRAMGTEEVDHLTSDRHTRKMKDGGHRGGGVRPNTSSLRGGRQQQERNKYDDEHCEQDENRNTGSSSGGEQNKIEA